ncbi:hypothetical protein FQN54_005259 [Arachnomyces sp. PD_36]|nr:hypothetical protein FQN54_005259 [Arachnomyces sp. PD_36]
MTPTASILPSLPEWRHLLRALLRECSYLPDPIARNYMHQYVVSSYRDHAPKYLPTPDVLPRRQMQLRRRARKTLSVLERANQGYSKPLDRVLLLSYGRIGKRRRQLLEPLIAQPVPSDDTAVDNLSTKFSDDWKPPATLIALLKDQSCRQDIYQCKVRPHLKLFQPTIPEENSWGRPIPRKRRKNIRKKWYAKALDSVYPPLPGQEWELLQGLVSGTVPWTMPKRRKEPIRNDVLPENTQILDPEFLVTGPKKGFTFDRWIRGRPHNITLRFMKRAWNRVSVLCPSMTWDATHQRWDIQWGSTQPRLPPVVKQVKRSSLFDGVDTKGKALRSPESCNPQLGG